jgi:ketosteroid isomerase-like protein
MSAHLDLAHRLYDAFRRSDPEGLLACLHPDFQGTVTAGLPDDLGGRYQGPESMLRDCWARVARRLDVRPVPERFLLADDDRVVVLGSYRGTARGGPRELDAAFAHVLHVRDGLIDELVQVTDSVLWARALEPPSGADVARSMLAAVRDRDAQALLDTYAEDIVIREAETLPYGGVYHGHEGGMAHGLGYLEAWDAWQSDDDRDVEPTVLEAGDRVVAVWRQKASAPGGARFDAPAISLMRMRDGKAAELQMFHFDTARIADFLRPDDEG